MELFKVGKIPNWDILNSSDVAIDKGRFIISSQLQGNEEVEIDAPYSDYPEIADLFEPEESMIFVEGRLERDEDDEKVVRLVDIKRSDKSF
jgi:hypothetical protein